MSIHHSETVIHIPFDIEARLVDLLPFTRKDFYSKICVLVMFKEAVRGMAFPVLQHLSNSSFLSFDYLLGVTHDLSLIH